MSESDLTQVSAEQDGRVLTGVGASVEDLQKTMERHAEEPPAAKPEPTNGNGAEPPELRGRKRYSHLNAEREAEKTRADAAEKERDELRAKLAQPAVVAEVASTAPVVAPAGTAAVPAAPTTDEPKRTKPKEDEVGTKYQSYADFAEDLADWKIEQWASKQDVDARVRSAIAADRAHQALDHHVGEMRSRAKQIYPDFNEVLAKGPGSDVDLGPTPEKAIERMEFVLRLATPEHILYALAKDAAETARLAQLSDVEFGLALAKFSPADTTVASPASTGARSVVAPPPYQPVGGGSKTTVLPSSALPSKAGYDFDKSGYREKRAQERGLKNRRG